MNERELCLWLLGFFEMFETDPPPMTSFQVDAIKKKLALVQRPQVFASWVAGVIESMACTNEGDYSRQPMARGLKAKALSFWETSGLQERTEELEQRLAEESRRRREVERSKP